MSEFADNIQCFNGMYKMPAPATPTTSEVGGMADRLVKFKHILAEELNEIEAIIPDAKADEEGVAEKKLDALVAVADLLGDIQVYCASEMAKYGISNDAVLDIIMQSNFSKMGADGKPIYDENQKLQKGPAYWRPEPKLREMIAAAMK